MKSGTVIFLSNFFNHHQKPFSDAMHKRLGDRYIFVETTEMPQERRSMGWEMDALPCYVVSCAEFRSHQKKYLGLIAEAEVVLIGSAPWQLVRKRILDNKLVFYYSEHPLKKGMEFWRYPDRLLRWHWHYPQNKNVHLLCASAYAAGDYARFGMFKNRSYKWGYFPETKRYSDLGSMIDQKKKNSLVWVGRYLDWKHPETAVELGMRLRAGGYSFELNMIGNGPLLEETQKRVKAAGLNDAIHILGAMTPADVRTYMEKAEIHIFTSDRNEGWGAVLNEAMNSACVSIANKQIGAAPFLIREGENGFLYTDADMLYEKVCFLLDNRKKRVCMAQNAYLTISEEWNAEMAADRLLALTECLLQGKEPAIQNCRSVCSKAAWERKEHS